MHLAGLVFALLASFAADAKPTQPAKYTVAQLELTLTASHAGSDENLAAQLSDLQLSQRLSSAQLDHLLNELPGDKSRQALRILADQSAFLDPPDAGILPNPTPPAAETRKMLVQLVNYVNTTLRQLPNLIASRSTTSFEDRPKEDVLESTDVVSYSQLPLHFVAQSTATITFRDRKEVLDTTEKHSAREHSGGLVTHGEFGSILATVLSDALKGKITWARWESGASGPVAVFHYEVAEAQSNYHVEFCCMVNGYNSDGFPEMQLFDQRSAYHGEIAFDPATGAILRMMLQAELPDGELVSSAGMVVEYGPVEIGGKTYICPLRSISILAAHTAQPPRGAFSRANYQGPTKTFLNDVQFGSYRRFGSEIRILSGDADSKQN